MANSISESSPNSVVTQVSPDSRTCSPLNSSAVNHNKSLDSYSIYHCSKTPDGLSRSFTIKSKLMSPAASSGPFCRICHEGDCNEDLISLCKCTGSVGLVHQTCMEKWLSVRRDSSDKCEICDFTFATIRSPKSLLQWCQSDQGNIVNSQAFLGDLACFSLITPLAAISAFLCFEGAKRQVMTNNSLEAGCLMALATFLITIYLVWNILTFRYHFKSYVRWRSVNQNVRLVRFRRKSNESNLQNVNVSANNEIGLQESATSHPSTPQSDLAQTIHSNSELTDIGQSSNIFLTDT